MTRFARAKGSKSSNEKKPEEATSWMEMKKAILTKSSQALSEVQIKETKEKKANTSSQTEWASLGDDSSQMLLSNLLKKQKSKNNIVELNNINEKDKKKIKKSDLSSEINSEIKKHTKNMKVKSKSKLFEEIGVLSNENNTKKINKKRKLVDVNMNNSKEMPVKKKRKEENSFKADDDSLKVKKKKKLRNIKKKLNCDVEKINTTVRPVKSLNTVQLRQNKKKNDEKCCKKEFHQKFKEKKNFFNNRNKFEIKNYKKDSSFVEELIVNGEKVPIVKFQGFNVTKEDAERLKKLRDEMIKEGIPRDKLEGAIKLERRRAEKALSRLKKAVCFHCRGFGHFLSNCPALTEKQNTSTGVCYKCGSTEHSAFECKVVKGTNFQFAECFICKEQGHIARQCPDNPKGLYPQGGACRECGDVTHLRKDCPKVITKKSEEIVTIGLRNDRNLECLDEEITSREKEKIAKTKKKYSAVKF